MSNKFTFHCPINDLSFGQVSVALLRELYARKVDTAIFPIGPASMESQSLAKELGNWIVESVKHANILHDRKTDPAIKLWHIRGGNETFSAHRSILFTFHETDRLTPTETHILKGLDSVIVTSRYTEQVFKASGLTNVSFVPLGFDEANFPIIDRSRLRIPGVVSFLLTGKAEKRKATYKTLSLWAKKYGNNKNFRLNCCISNPHLKPDDQNGLINRALDGKSYWNINFIQRCASNQEYNSVLQSSDIILSCSGGEGFNLPLYHAVALGSWPVALNAHAHKDYLTHSNAVLIEPKGTISCTDGIFFQEGGDFNQGNFFDFDDESFYHACEQAVEKVKNVGENTEGRKLRLHNYSKVLDDLMKIVG